MGSSKHVGECRLCLAQGVPLNDSHILPKWSYRRATDSTAALGNPSPVHFADGSVFQSSAQVTEYLLCDTCEQRLGRDEDYVSKLACGAAPGDRRLGLLAHVDLKPGPIMKAKIGKLDRVDTAAIARFGASVFWRAHVSSREQCESLFLWQPQAEALARYLRGDGPLPASMCITLMAPLDEDGTSGFHTSTVAFPATYAKGEDSGHQFVVTGLMFTLTTGQETRGRERICLACGSEPHVLFPLPQNVRTLATLATSMLTSPRKGRLQRLFDSDP